MKLKPSRLHKRLRRNSALPSGHARCSQGRNANTRTWSEPSHTRLCQYLRGNHRSARAPDATAWQLKRTAKMQLCKLMEGMYAEVAGRRPPQGQPRKHLMPLRDLRKTLKNSLCRKWETRGGRGKHVTSGANAEEPDTTTRGSDRRGVRRTMSSVEKLQTLSEVTKSMVYLYALSNIKVNSVLVMLQICRSY